MLVFPWHRSISLPMQKLIYETITDALIGTNETITDALIGTNVS